MEFEKEMIVQGYKRELISSEPKNNGRYLYKILAKAKNEETGEEMVVYQSLFGEFQIFVDSIEKFKMRMKPW